MNFKNIIGQQAVKKVLINAVKENRIPHAQLFLGPKGSGKLALAIAFAQYALCSNRQADDICGRCSNCIKASKMIHPDLHFSYPTVGTKVISTHFIKEWRAAILENPYLNVNQWLKQIKAENKQGNITKDECVAIVKKLSLKTYEGSHKILIMWLPEYLGKEGNRLLKLIEEPPENTLFILVAENEELILNTILSRCQILKINPLSDEDIINGLIEREGATREKAINIARLANGNFNEAMSLIDNTENDNVALFLKWFRTCYKGNGLEMVEWVNTFAKEGRENQKYFLTYALHFLREYMLLKVTGRADNIRLQGNEKATAERMTKVIAFEQVGKITALLNDAFFHVERNANAKVLFLDTSIQLHKILRRKK